MSCMCNMRNEVTRLTVHSNQIELGYLCLIVHLYCISVMENGYLKGYIVTDIQYIKVKSS